jgi:hypothetical protein
MIFEEIGTYLYLNDQSKVTVYKNDSSNEYAYKRDNDNWRIWLSEEEFKSKFVEIKEVPFETMLKCDGEIICDCWLLSNSINKYGIDLTKAMLFNDFLKLIGTYLTSLNCKSLFSQAKWFVIDDGNKTIV